MAPDRELVVVGYDGSQGSEAALRVAVREARLRQARLRLVSAWHVPTYAYGSLAVPAVATGLGEDLRRELERQLENTVSQLRDTESDLPIDSRLVEGAAASALIKEAAGADLLVVGSRGLGGFRELLLGSVSHQCALHASCPVLIVPPEAAPTAQHAEPDASRSR
jgi:nucleotide-binding universal stress UspA family protein